MSPEEFLLVRKLTKLDASERTGTHSQPAQGNARGVVVPR